MFKPERLKRVIEKEGLSQNQFAKKINMSAATVSRVLTGQIGLSSNMLEKLKVAFPEYALDYFFDDKNA